MTKGETSSTFKTPADMSAKESRLFTRWLINNAVLGSVVAAGLIAIVVIGPTRPKPFATVQTASGVNTNIGAAAISLVASAD